MWFIGIVPCLGHLERQPCRRPKSWLSSDGNNLSLYVENAWLTPCSCITIQPGPHQRHCALWAALTWSSLLLPTPSVAPTVGSISLVLVPPSPSQNSSPPQGQLGEQTGCGSTGPAFSQGGLQLNGTQAPRREATLMPAKRASTHAQGTTSLSSGCLTSRFLSIM